MARTLQASLGEVAEAQVCLFMRTGALASEDPLAVADQKQVELFDSDTNDRPIVKLRQGQDRNPFCDRSRHRARRRLPSCDGIADLDTDRGRVKTIAGIVDLGTVGDDE